MSSLNPLLFIWPFTLIMGLTFGGSLMVAPERSMIPPGSPTALQWNCMPVFSQLLHQHGANLGRTLLGPSKASRAMSRVLVEHLWEQVCA